MIKKTYRFIILIIIINIMTASIALAAKPEFWISSFPSKFKTIKNIINIKGKVKNADKFYINGTQVDFSKNGYFKAALILKPGKNLIKATAVGANGKANTTYYKVIHLVSFPDIRTSWYNWARVAIENLATIGVAEGYPDGKFKQNQALTRGELATWLAKAKKLPINKNLTKDVFYDVPKEHWRAPYIKAIVDKKYMQPKSGQAFGVDDPISRADAADIVAKAEKLNTKRVMRVFSDVPISHEEAKAIYLAYKKKLVIGISRKSKIFDPSRNITRAEAATLFHRLPITKRRIEYLYDFNKGYSNSYCKVNTGPKVKNVSVTPSTIYVGQDELVTVMALIEDRQGPGDISLIKADLRNLGGPPDAQLTDNGEGGDSEANDGWYTITFKTKQKVSGAKSIQVVAIDQLGWEDALGEEITVLE